MYTVYIFIYLQIHIWDVGQIIVLDGFEIVRFYFQAYCGILASPDFLLKFPSDNLCPYITDLKGLWKKLSYAQDTVISPSTTHASVP